MTTQPHKRAYTLKPERLPSTELKVSLLRAVAARPLPARVDLRPRCPPVYDQGDLGSCTANALAAAVQYAVPTLPGSRLFLYYNERAIDGDVSDDAGSTLSTGVASLQRNGLCPESAWPYVPDLFTTKPSPHAYAVARQHLFPHHAHVLPTKNEMMACLAAGWPFVVGIMVYASFESDAVAATGVVPMPGADEQCLGGHAVLCVGYDAAKGHWIMRNSWGSQWGDHGYFYLPFAYLTDKNLSSDLWRVTTTTMGNVVRG